MTDQLQQTIDAAWEDRASVDYDTKGAVRDAVESALALLDSGAARVAAPDGAGGWRVNQWLKKAVLLSFRLNDMAVIPGGPDAAVWWDKVVSKFDGWDAGRFRDAGFRAVPGAIVRRSAFVAPGVVLMPSFVNVGAYVGENTMVASPTWAPRLTKDGIRTTLRPMKAERRTMAPGTARNPASRKRFSLQPANLEGTLSHHMAQPGPPSIRPMSLSRKDNSTAFFNHWLIAHEPSACFSATRALPESSSSSAASTASRTAPVVEKPMASRLSKAASMVWARSAWDIKTLARNAGTGGTLPVEPI